MKVNIVVVCFQDNDFSSAMKQVGNAMLSHKEDFEYHLETEEQFVTLLYDTMKSVLRFRGKADRIFDHLTSRKSRWANFMGTSHNILFNDDAYEFIAKNSVHGCNAETLIIDYFNKEVTIF
jgi:hypothetical protein